MKRSSILGLIIISISIAIIVSLYFDSGTYRNFENLRDSQSEVIISCTLNKKKPFVYDPTKDANHFSFYAVDENGMENQVIFLGAKPQDFERSETLVITGSMKGDQFYASKMLLKCPSKYKNEQIEITSEKS